MRMAYGIISLTVHRAAPSPSGGDGPHHNAINPILRMPYMHAISLSGFSGISSPFCPGRPVCTGRLLQLLAAREGLADRVAQLDIFEKTPEKAIMAAERIILLLNGSDAGYGSTLFDSMRLERASLIRVEDGTWKVPIEITANCIRRK